MAESKSRFATLSEEDLNLLLDDKDAKSTKRATKSALKVFQQYIWRNWKSRLTSNERYACERAQTVLCRSSKSGWHFLFKEHIKQPQIWIKHFKATCGFDIINDTEFNDANKVFGAKCVDLKRQGLAKVEHKPPICEEDLKKLYESTAFGLDDPEKLQKQSFFWRNAVLLSPRKVKSPSTPED